jgi:hypothetical protein
MSVGGENHIQGIARTQKLSDGSIYFFLVRSDLSARGNVLQYRYAGPTDQEHVLKTSPFPVVPAQQILLSTDQHPSDITFLPEVNELDAGYLFVTEEYDNHRLTVYRWEAGQDLAVHGYLFAGFPAVPSDSGEQGGPQFVFLDLVDDYYYLAVASEHWGWGQLFRASPESLFPNCAKGSLNLDAFQPQEMFPFPVIGGACQTKLIKDSKGKWYLLGYRSDPQDKANGTDYVDVFGVRFNPFVISYKLCQVHIFFPAGDTGFANSGTHYVEKTGRLLISSSYRWAENIKPIADPVLEFAFRVDELSSW